MIAILGNRPALQVGRHQVLDYDTDWIEEALVRAARAAGHEDFPFIGEIRTAIVEYLESKCSLKLLSLEELFDRVRRMLRTIGCESIAEQISPVAPPVTFSLIHAAMVAGNGFELAFFESLRIEMQELRRLGVYEIHFTGLQESVHILSGSTKWNRKCGQLQHEIEEFLHAWQMPFPAAGKAA